MLSLAMACPGRAARLSPSPPAACFPGERPPLPAVEHLCPAMFPQSPEELGDMLAPGSGLPRELHLTALLCPPMSQGSGKKSQVHCSTIAICWQLKAKKKAVLLGNERSGVW